MKTIRQLLCAATLTLLASSYAFANPIYVYNGHSYTLTDHGSWIDAEAAAVALGGHLVTINDQAEQDWLIATFGTQSYFWIGINDYDQEGVFVWSSGEAVTYTNWSLNEPNDYLGGFPGEDGAAMNWRAGGQWNDFPDSWSLYGIAEIASVPEPGTFALLGLGLVGLGLSRRKKI